MIEYSYDWPGWSLSKNKFGKEFDIEARKRMVDGRLKLNPFIKKYYKKLGTAILEIGPFFDPLIIPSKFKSKEIFYIDSDHYVKEYLTERFSNITFLLHNLNTEDENEWFSIEVCIMKELRKKNLKKFDAIVLSQVINYIDYKKVFSLIKKYHTNNGLIFINNVIDYGIPSLFSDKRPRSDNELIEYLEKIGYKLIEKEIIATWNKDIQKNNRLILVIQQIK